MGHASAAAECLIKTLKATGTSLRGGVPKGFLRLLGSQGAARAGMAWVPA